MEFRREHNHRRSTTTTRQPNLTPPRTVSIVVVCARAIWRQVPALTSALSSRPANSIIVHTYPQWRTFVHTNCRQPDLHGFAQPYESVVATLSFLCFSYFVSPRDRITLWSFPSGMSFRALRGHCLRFFVTEEEVSSDAAARGFFFTRPARVNRIDGRARRRAKGAMETAAIIVRGIAELIASGGAAFRHRRAGLRAYCCRHCKPQRFTVSRPRSKARQLLLLLLLLFPSFLSDFFRGHFRSARESGHPTGTNPRQ